MVKKVKLENLKLLYDLLKRDFMVYAPLKKENGLVFDLTNKFNLSFLDLGLTVMPFKNVLLKEIYDVENDPQTQNIALFGLHLCDIKAITILDGIFKTDPFYESRRQKMLIIGTECKPTNNCFCELFDANKFTGFDLYIEQDNEDYKVFARSEIGVSYLQKINGKSIYNEKPKPISKENTILNQNTLINAVNNRLAFEDHWQAIANNCFGCGACTAVCPLCFCFDIIDKTNPKNGQCHRARHDDSCFFDKFSQISNYDFRPKNVDRLYNWYHHKFVRGPKTNGHFLCVGCGRCIDACPANLNIKKILGFIDKEFNNHLTQNEKSI